MDPKQFKDFCDKAKAGGAIDFTSRSHYEQMSPLFEAHAEVVECTAADFHNLGTVSNVTTYYPKKETTDKFGQAAGLSFSTVTVGTRKDSPLCFVGRAQAETLGPDGQKASWAAAEYEYDAEVRAEMEILENQKKYGKTSKFNGESGEIEKKGCYLQHRKVARRRADTGARAAAIISAIGMPTGFKDLFKGRDKVVFLFSRIIYNAKNKAVMDRALDNMFGAAKLISGPQEIGDEIVNVEDMRQADDQETTVSKLASEAVDDGFGEDAPPAQPNPSVARSRIQNIWDNHRTKIPPKAQKSLESALNDPDTPDSRFDSLFVSARDYLEPKGIAV